MNSTTMTEPTTIFGYAIDDYKADDGNGHVGLGSTPEAAETALEHAQENDVGQSYNTWALGWCDTHTKSNRRFYENK